MEGYEEGREDIQINERKERKDGRTMKGRGKMEEEGEVRGEVEKAEGKREMWRKKEKESRSKV